MKPPNELPGGLPDAFTVADARGAGVPYGRTRHRTLHRPFHGVRVRVPPTDLRALTRAYRRRLRPDHAFGGLSAAALWGIPVPFGLFRSTEVHLLAPTSTHPASGRGVRTRRIVDERFEVVSLDGVAVSTPVLTWCLLARDLSTRDLVVAGDAIVTSSDVYPGLAARRPLATLEQLIDATARWRGMHGARRLRDAVSRIRDGVDSPKETETRLALVDGGVPEPIVQGIVRDPLTGASVARCDLLDDEARIAYEYDGDHHRTPGQHRKDVTRQSAIEDCGYHVMRITDADLHPTPAAFVARATRLRASRLA